MSAAYRPAGDGQEVGGDFYDIFQIAGGDWVVALGDVCGKGVEAAVLTALVRHTILALTVGQEASGGHPLPLHLRRNGVPVQVGTTGTLMGMLADVRLTDTVLRLDPGDLLVMYTDGVTEGRHGTSFFGDSRLHRSVLTHRDAPSSADGILGDVLDFGDGSARDDIAVVALRVPSPVPSQPQPPSRQVQNQPQPVRQQDREESAT